MSACLLFLMADSTAVMRSTTGICSGATAKFSHLTTTSFSGWVSSLLDKFFTQFSCMPGCAVRLMSLFLLRRELLFYCFKVLNFRVCRSLHLVCCDACAFSTNVDTFSRTLHGSSDVSSSNVWPVFVVSVSLVKSVMLFQ